MTRDTLYPKCGTCGKSSSGMIVYRDAYLCPDCIIVKLDQLAALASRSPEGEWTSVEERLPPPSRENEYHAGTLLVIRQGRVCMDTFWFAEQEKRRKSKDDYAITHWRPLPSPPSTPSPEETKR